MSSNQKAELENRTAAVDETPKVEEKAELI